MGGEQYQSATGHPRDLVMPVEQLILFDIQVTQWINQLHHPVADVIFGVVSRLGDAGAAWMAVAVMLAIFGARRERVTTLIFVSILMMTEYLIMPYLRELWPRPRPFLYLEGIRTIGPEWDRPAFPSSHSHLWVQATVLFAGVYPRLRWPLIVLMVLSLYSRPYVGNHHVLDVVGGAVVGLGAGMLGLTIASKLGLIADEMDEPATEDPELDITEV